ncbi:MAG: signal peptidase I [Eubacterium sp.]|nr:signal peptidase I [Eubacterium sp.]MCM1216620.1 signal peptidase I [Lachnospiraceae bacterium]MCM1303025.1 signal peptidase I [Butyrivibrio sp.]MCM1345236.1 signal peptidase I [Muribaculaceae bacterium]MCM1239711.1 signal peptidase I [Lachnospiraceae bacterium]
MEKSMKGTSKSKGKGLNKVLREMISTLLYLLIVLCLTYFVINYVGQRTEVWGASMESTLNHGDNLIVDKITYRFRDPQRFDIIVFPFQYEENTYYIKRIIGLPGETVQIGQDGTIYINGEALEENYGREIIKPENIGIAASPVTLGADEYFVMGDNRNNSSDSRTEVVGNIHRDDIIGRAWMRIWPLSEIGILKHQ